MAGPILGYTQNYGFAKLNFDAVRWGNEHNNNFDLLDATLKGTGLISTKGFWTNNTPYIIGDRVVDPVGAIYICRVTHTSPATGTFAADRATNPTRWANSSLKPLYRGTWTNNTSYAAFDIASVDQTWKMCVEDHTSDTTTNSFTSNKWVTIVDITAEYTIALQVVDAANTVVTLLPAVEAVRDEAIVAVGAIRDETAIISNEAEGHADAAAASAIAAANSAIEAANNVPAVNAIAAVRHDIVQGLDSLQRARARSNIGIGADTFIIDYASRNNIRSIDNRPELMYVITGLGLFAWQAGSTAIDDDEMCFATASGRWLLQAAAWDVAYARWLPEIDRLAQTNILFGQAICTINSVASSTFAEFTARVEGAVRGDYVAVNAPNALDTGSITGVLNYYAWVSAPNIVTIRIINPSANGATVNLASVGPANPWSIVIIKNLGV